MVGPICKHLKGIYNLNYKKYNSKATELPVFTRGLESVFGNCDITAEGDVDVLGIDDLFVPIRLPQGAVYKLPK